MTNIPLQSITFPDLPDNIYDIPRTAENIAYNETAIYSEGTVGKSIQNLSRGQHLYGARWDRVTNNLERLYDAEDFPTNTDNFCHKGTFNQNIDNPFDQLYPWKDMVVCDVDLVKYRSGNYALEDCIKAFYGDPNFTYFGDENTFVGRYRPEFWYKSEEDSSGRVTYMVSTVGRIGFKHAPASIAGISFCVDVGNSKVSSGAGVPLANIACSTIHSRAKSSGFTLVDINDLDADIVLFLVEYANMNAQNAIGDGCSNCYRENAADAITAVDNSGEKTTITVDDASFSGVAYVGADVHIGATVGAVTYKAIIEAVSVSGTAYTINLDRKLESVEVGMYASVHGFATCEFPYIGQSVGNGSGYIGTAGKANAFYRGRVLFANLYNYILGIYRQTSSNRIWLCPDNLNPDDFDALDTSKHYDTGVSLPDVAGSWLTVGGNAQRISGLAGFMATGESSGSSTSPVGDQQYVPVKTAGNTILFAGGNASHGWPCGVFSGHWHSAAGSSYWPFAASPLLKNPQ